MATFHPGTTCFQEPLRLTKTNLAGIPERIPMDQPEQPIVDFTELTAHVVSSYVANNAVHRADLPTMIATVYGALHGLAAPKPAELPKQQPAVSVKKSVTADFLISLE